jgi:hypothetical protein
VRRALVLAVGSLAALIVTWADRRREGCLHAVNERAMMGPMQNSTDRLVLVPATQLDDLLELSRCLAERLPESDPLRSSLIGATSAVRACALPEP